MALRFGQLCSPKAPKIEGSSEVKTIGAIAHSSSPYGGNGYRKAVSTTGQKMSNMVMMPDCSAALAIFAGMSLRLLTEYRPELVASRLGLRPVPEDRIVLVGARDLDPPEVTYLDQAPIRRQVTDLPVAELPDGPLYVYVDLDVIDAALANV